VINEDADYIQFTYALKIIFMVSLLKLKNNQKNQGVNNLTKHNSFSMKIFETCLWLRAYSFFKRQIIKTLFI